MTPLSGPVVVGGTGDRPATGLVVVPAADGLPRIAWLGPAPLPDPAEVAAVIGDAPCVPRSNHEAAGRAVPLLPEATGAWPARPGLAGHRVGGTSAGWATAFTTSSMTGDAGAVVVQARDAAAGLSLRSEIESVSGGPVRVRHVLTNDAAGDYVVDSLDVTVPVPDRVAEVLDCTGRWGRERVPQRHPVGDGVWTREGRGGRTGHDAPTQLLVGTAGFGFRTGEVWGLHVAWSGNTRHALERQPSGLVTLVGGEVLLPGEVVLRTGESYATPWVFLTASATGLDAIAAQNHAYVRSLPARPRLPRPVTSNVWEAVYFDHDLDRLTGLADLASSIGIERFVLDDGWFGSRRDDTSGLGDWTVSADAWPGGLGPLVEHVTGLGMQFGLWFEPEMVNADSDLHRAHPDWILGVRGRTALEFRHQLVLDLGRAEVRDHLFDAIDAVLSAHDIGYVKWDHNRLLPEAAARDRGDAAGAHAATAGFYDLLDRLRAAHPDVEWESCASGGGRIDLAVIERVERFWTSDMTDALARQVIQRWTGQLVPPEYLGAHVSATTNHQTGRTMSLDFRAATAFFGDFGVEWDVASATPDERARLATWIGAYKEHRDLLHTGHVVRVDSPDPDLWTYGVVSAGLDEAVMVYVQLDETVRDPLPMLVPGLDPHRRYTVREVVADEERPWSADGLTVSGAVLASVGLPAPPRRPLSARVVHLSALAR